MSGFQQVQANNQHITANGIDIELNWCWEFKESVAWFSATHNCITLSCVACINAVVFLSSLNIRFGFFSSSLVSHSVGYTHFNAHIHGQSEKKLDDECRVEKDERNIEECRSIPCDCIQIIRTNIPYANTNTNKNIQTQAQINKYICQFSK